MADDDTPPVDPDDEIPYIEPVVPALDEPLDLSPDVAAHNYTDLVRLYYRKTRAPLAVKVFTQARAGTLTTPLSVVLRDHHERTIDDPDEIDWREGFDHLLTCYSVLELALQAGYITGLSPAMRRDARAILEDPAVRPFYEEHYTLLLPQLLRMRLADGRSYQAQRGPRQIAALQRTLELERRLLARPDVVAFLTLADDFWVDGFNRASLLDAVDDPDTLVTHLKRRRARTFLDQAVFGLLQFLHLCEGLHLALRSVEGDAVFQSSIWHLFGYWFADRREAVVPTLRTLIKQRLIPAAGLEDTLEPVTQRQAQELLDIIDDLASARYAPPLREAFQALAVRGR